MSSTKSISSLLILLLTSISLVGQVVPVPDRKDRTNPYSGNPTQLPGESVDQAEARDSFVDNRVYSDLFGIGLPSFFREGQWRLRMNPKFGDFFDDEYVRFPLGVEYSFSNHFEGFLGVGTYFPNPFNSGGDWGSYNMRVGGKYSWWGFADTDYNLSVGFDSKMPWSNPPIEVADGWARHEVYVSASRELSQDPAKLIYLNIAHEFVGTSPFESNPISPRPKDRIFIRPGIIYYPGGNFRYSAELEYRTSILDGRTSNPLDYEEWVGTREYTRAFDKVHEVIFSPGITWFPTDEFREGFIVPGNWDVGIKLDIPIIEETDENIGVSLRFRWYYDYDQYLKNYIKSWWPLGRGER